METKPQYPIVLRDIDEILNLDVARWITTKIKELPSSGRFRAASAIRSLNWAHAIYSADMAIPAAYFALHATEEAVASFISCAKECGYGADAKMNLRDHQVKATVSLLAEKVSNLLAPAQPGIAVQPQNDTLVARLIIDGQDRFYDKASTKIIHFTDGKSANPRSDFFNELIQEFKDIDELKQAVIAGQEARNKIMYATADGLPTGFIDPQVALRRECLLTLGLIWAGIDIVRHKDEQIPLIVQALRTANMVIKAVKRKKEGDCCSE